MSYYLSENGYVCYARSGVPLGDTHGGYSLLHRREQEDVINDIVDQRLEFAMTAIKESIAEAIAAYATEVWRDLISSLKGALNTDVISEVEIAFENAEEIFHSKKAQEYVAKNAYKALEKELNKLKSIKVSL